MVKKNLLFLLILSLLACDLEAISSVVAKKENYIDSPFFTITEAEKKFTVTAEEEVVKRKNDIDNEEKVVT